MSVMRSLIGRIRRPLPSCLEGPIDRVPLRVTAHQTSTFLGAITRPGSRAPLCCQRGHRCHRCLAIPRPASPPSSAPLGPSTGSTLSVQPKVRQYSHPAAQPVLARRRAQGRIGDEEF
ncbi:hypothetical protein NDU88_004145 [Pleurodeles waltl]|uniref:Uncharacterized protein n=1 Tax=Pleurodeles waltl TaxID=8319 RepID=A0AAV7T8R6_PLEWA|nr:hypothetical protein NDU88_004145 [Pleurodeles waltl]